MSLTITWSIPENIGIDFASHLLANSPSISELEKELNPYNKSDVAAVMLAIMNVLHVIISSSYPSASSMLLQANTNDLEPKLFLFPDGSGSAVSYASLPTLSTNLAVFGLNNNSPFLKSPRD